MIKLLHESSWLTLILSYHTEWIRDLEWALVKWERLIFIESLLTTCNVFWVAWSWPEIGSSLKLNHYSQVKLLQTPDTHCRNRSGYNSKVKLTTNDGKDHGGACNHDHFRIEGADVHESLLISLRLSFSRFRLLLFGNLTRDLLAWIFLN